MGGGRLPWEVDDRRGRWKIVAMSGIIDKLSVLTVFFIMYLAWPSHRRGPTGIAEGTKISSP